MTPRLTRRLVRLAAGANVAAVLAFSLAWAWSLTLLRNNDETGHFDYAYQVWHGRLPVFEDGVSVKPPFASIPPVQWTAQHPPLFYVIEAPFIGPFVDQRTRRRGGVRRTSRQCPDGGRRGAGP